MDSNEAVNDSTEASYVLLLAVAHVPERLVSVRGAARRKVVGALVLAPVRHQSTGNKTKPWFKQQYVLPEKFLLLKVHRNILKFP